MKASIRVRLVVIVLSLAAFLAITAGCSKGSVSKIQAKLDTGIKANGQIEGDIALIQGANSKELDAQTKILTARNEFTSIATSSSGSTFPDQNLNDMQVGINDLETVVGEHRLALNKLISDTQAANKTLAALVSLAEKESAAEAGAIKRFVQKNAEVYRAQVQGETARFNAVNRQLDLYKKQYEQLKATNTTDAATFNAAADAFEKYAQEMVDVAEIDKKMIEALDSKTSDLNQAVLKIISELEDAGLDFKRQK